MTHHSLISKVVSLMLLFAFTAGCTVQPAPVITQSPTIQPSMTTPPHTATPIPTQTSFPTETNTPVPTATATLPPTPIGLTSPRLAVWAKDSQGQINLYIGDLYDGNLTSIATVGPSIKIPSWERVKWSADGKQLAFVNSNPQNGKSIYIYDVSTKSTKNVLNLPRNADLIRLQLSPDATQVAYGLYLYGSAT